MYASRPLVQHLDDYAAAKLALGIPSEQVRQTVSRIRAVLDRCRFTLPGDTSASDRYYREDLTPPFVLDGGRLAVPTGPGIGVDIDEVCVDRVTVSRRLLRRAG